MEGIRVKKRIAILLFILISISLVGCSEIQQNSGIKNSDEFQTTPIPTYIPTEEINPTPTEKIVEEEIEHISNDSMIAIINILDTGEIWTLQQENDELFIVLTNIDGEILKKVPYRLKEGDGMECGINDTLIITANYNDFGIYDNDFGIYDVNTMTDITFEYIEQDEKIVFYTQTDDNIYFWALKTLDTFEEKYVEIRIIDLSTEEVLFLSLDSETLIKEYNIERTYSVENIDIGDAGNGVCYITYLGSAYEYENNSIVIDLNRKRVTPVPFPRQNGAMYSSDGDNMIIFSNVAVHGFLLLNLETQEVVDYPNRDFDPEGSLAEGLFHGVSDDSSNDSVVLDVNGNVVIDLQQYPQPVDHISTFHNGIALVEFENDYFTFIDRNGNFLFEPIKGYYPQFYQDTGVIIAEKEKTLGSMESTECICVEKSGRMTSIEIPAPANPYSLRPNEYVIALEGKIYCIAGSSTGLYAQELIFE